MISRAAMQSSMRRLSPLSLGLSASHEQSLASTSSDPLSGELTPLSAPAKPTADPREHLRMCADNTSAERPIGRFACVARISKALSRCTGDSRFCEFCIDSERANEAFFAGCGVTHRDVVVVIVSSRDLRRLRAEDDDEHEVEADDRVSRHDKSDSLVDSTSQSVHSIRRGGLLILLPLPETLSRE
jgi:hypothetical protein